MEGEVGFDIGEDGRRDMAIPVKCSPKSLKLTLGEQPSGPGLRISNVEVSILQSQELSRLVCWILESDVPVPDPLNGLCLDYLGVEHLFLVGKILSSLANELEFKVDLREKRTYSPWSPKGKKGKKQATVIPIPLSGQASLNYLLQRTGNTNIQIEEPEAKPIMLEDIIRRNKCQSDIFKLKVLTF
mmetsp:Transcript_25211/g.44822  ORF Transcript_25211/g.44822 Transcript_25211/m.44822 type:complete len:186 (+) Transcript_25211:564-1121(+)